jgi:hypothetical protein
MIGVACRPSWEKHHSLDWFSRGKWQETPRNSMGKAMMATVFTKKMSPIFCRPERSCTGWIERPPTGWCRLLREKLEGQFVS